jgi:hypothetical protein
MKTEIIPTYERLRKSRNGHEVLGGIFQKMQILRTLGVAERNILNK